MARPRTTLASLLLVAGCATSSPSAVTTPTVTTPTATTPTTTTLPATAKASPSLAPSRQEPAPVQIQLTAADTVLTVTLVDSDAARALVAQLPLELAVEDFHGSEKIATLPAPLPGPASGMEPVAGDVAYFTPWGNLSLYYGTGTPSADLVPLGRLDGDPSSLEDLADGTTVRIALP